MNTINIHQPERAANESFQAYKQRRKDSKAAAQAMILAGPWQPGVESSRTALRNAMRQSGKMKKTAGQYGRGLRNWIVNQNRAAQAQRLGKRQRAA